MILIENLEDKNFSIDLKDNNLFQIDSATLPNYFGINNVGNQGLQVVQGGNKNSGCIVTDKNGDPILKNGLFTSTGNCTINVQNIPIGSSGPFPAQYDIINLINGFIKAIRDVEIDGEQGQVGLQGPIGPAGPKGPKGDKGDIGPQGQ